MHSSAYYDSCIFLNALNTTHAQYDSCARITEPRNIRWIVWVCVDLITSETTASELLSSFEVNCALSGVILVHVNLKDANEISKKYKNQKIQLNKMQLKNRDFMHLICAVHASASALVSVDPDFWDAENKRNPGAKKKSSETKKYIETNFPISIIAPAELIAMS